MSKHLMSDVALLLRLCSDVTTLRCDVSTLLLMSRHYVDVVVDVVTDIATLKSC